MPATPKPSKAKTLKNLWKHEGRPVSLRQFAIHNDEVKDSIGKDWLFNKKVKFSKPSLGIGSTRNKKKQGGKQK